MPQQSPGFLLWRVTLAWQRVIRSALAPYGLTHTQFVLLTSLWWFETHDDRPPTQRRLAEHAATDPMMTSQVIRKLADRDLVSRSTDPDDARVQLVHLTVPGRSLVTSAVRSVEDADRSYFSTIPTAELRTAFTNALHMLSEPADPHTALQRSPVSRAGEPMSAPDAEG